MSPEPSFLDKIDPLLEDKLANAPDNEILRVVMNLKEENKPHAEQTVISPADFPNRIEYRKALIAQQQKQLARDIGATKQAIENLGLKTYGGVNTSSLIVEGIADRILDSLELSGVVSATLDRPFTAVVPPSNFSNFKALESLFWEIAQQAKISEPKSKLNRLFKFFGGEDSNVEERNKQIISLAVQEYTSKYYKDYGNLKVLGMRQPVKLESIYTNVRLLEKKELFTCTSIEELEEIERKNKRSINREENDKIIQGLKLANQKQYLMVFGEPGSGKSTFLKRVALEAFKGKKSKYNHCLIPVFIELKRFNNSEIDIAKTIADDFANCGLNQSQEYVETGLDSGKFLIILDGLDEVRSSNLESAIAKINDFVEQYKKNRFIISCRTALKQSFKDFTEVVIADFNNEQIEQFINNWFSSPQDQQAEVAKKCWELLQANKNARELAKTPLLLTFLCLVYERGQNFPQNRSELYGKALRILLEEWAAEKRIPQNEIYRRFNRELEEILLSEIAYDNFVQDKLFFTKEEIIKTIESFPSRNINAPEKLNGEAILNAIAIQQGVLVERAANIYAFSHLTLQEYLTALYIVDNNLIEDLVGNYATDKRWQEVFLLVAGLMRGGVDKLLLLLEQEARNYLQTPIGKEKLVPLLEWAENITKDSTGDIKPVTKKIIAYISAYSYNYPARYSTIYTEAKANNTTYPSASIFDRSYTQASSQAYAFANWYTKNRALKYFEAYTYISNYNSVYDYFYECAQATADFLNISIVYTMELKEASRMLEVFKNVDFSQLIDKLTALESEMPFSQESANIHLSFIKKIKNIWWNAFQLSPELIDFYRGKEREINDKYFYINWLIIQCKEAAVKLSPETWQEIEDRMLLP